MIVPIFKQDNIVEKNIHEIIDFMDKSTYRPPVIALYRNFVKGYEFCGQVWPTGFSIRRNVDFSSSVAPIAKAHIAPINETQSKVHLEIGPHGLVAILLGLVLMVTLFIGGLTIYEIVGNGIGLDAVLLIIMFTLLGSALFLFIRFGFYSRYAKLKKRMVELLTPVLNINHR